MKKLMTLAALVAACAPAFTAEVTSSNTVGYQKLTFGTMNILGVQFEKVGGGAINIQDVTPSGDAAESWGTDWIKVYDANTGRYTTLYWFGDPTDGIYEPEDTEYDNSLGVGWADGNQFIVSNVTSLTAGRGFWAESEDGGTLIVSGQIASNVISVGDMALASNPLPMDVKIQDIKLGGNAASSWGTDFIKIYNASTGRYTTLYWFGDATDGIYEPEDTEYDNSLGVGWADGNQFIVKDLSTIAAGQGFWVQSENGGTLIFPDPNAAND